MIHDRSRSEEGLRGGAVPPPISTIQIVRGDLGLGDEIRCEPATAEEVLAGRSRAERARTTTERHRTHGLSLLEAERFSDARIVQRRTDEVRLVEQDSRKDGIPITNMPAARAAATPVGESSSPIEREGAAPSSSQARR